MSGLGKTVTTKSTESPVHPFALGNKRYVTVWETKPLFLILWKMVSPGAMLFE
jgi:hypothetical protein